MTDTTDRPALRDDPRVDPRLVAAVAPMGLADPLPPSTIDAGTDLEVIRKVLGKLEAGSAKMLEFSTAGLPEVTGVDRSTETVTGADGNEVTLYVHRPSTVDEPVPGILHLHGGGGVMLSAADVGYVRWRDELAALGTVVVGVEFRNGAGRLGTHPFPAGLNDCAAGLEWIDANRSELGLSAVLVSGDSGGGNLSLATALKAKRDGVLARVDGVYALCPYVSNAYAAPTEDLPSLTDNDGLLVSVAMLGAMAKAYTPEDADADNPLAWPHHASGEDVADLPPHAISVNELDPLRDEGLAYYRKLLAAGVPARCRTVNGTFHAAENNYFAAIPDVVRATLSDIVAFARSL
ncbi:MAG: alpha/beta hydrolase [Acidimicrobiales bacterium]|nr:alpha/beta hydrolase [Acidimicrobiales bacterium]